MIEDLVAYELSEQRVNLALKKEIQESFPNNMLLEKTIKRLEALVDQLEDLVEHPPVLFVDRLDDQWPRDKNGCLVKPGDTIRGCSDGIYLVFSVFKPVGKSFSIGIECGRRSLLLHECELMDSKTPDARINGGHVFVDGICAGCKQLESEASALCDEVF